MKTETTVYERENGKTITYNLTDIDRYVVREIPDYTGNPDYEITFFFLDDKSFEFVTNESSSETELAIQHMDMVAKEQKKTVQSLKPVLLSDMRA